MLEMKNACDTPQGVLDVGRWMLGVVHQGRGFPRFRCVLDVGRWVLDVVHQGRGFPRFSFLMF